MQPVQGLLSPGPRGTALMSLRGAALPGPHSWPTQAPQRCRRPQLASLGPLSSHSKDRPLGNSWVLLGAQEVADIREAEHEADVFPLFGKR